MIPNHKWIKPEAFSASNIHNKKCFICVSGSIAKANFVANKNKRFFVIEGQEIKDITKIDGVTVDDGQGKPELR